MGKAAGQKRARTLTGDRVQLPIVGDAFECVHAAVYEADSGTDDQVLHGPRGEKLVGSREVADASCDDDAEAGDVVSAQLHLSGVEPGPDIEAQRLGPRSDLLCACDGAGRAIERGQQSVTGRLDET